MLTQFAFPTQTNDIVKQLTSLTDANSAVICKPLTLTTDSLRVINYTRSFTSFQFKSCTFITFCHMFLNISTLSMDTLNSTDKKFYRKMAKMEKRCRSVTSRAVVNG